MNKFGVVILARYSSSRLPGKALLDINGIPVLQYILERVTEVVPIENVIIATSDERSDDAIENFAFNYGVDCYRGSLNNVSRRFFEAGKTKNLDYAIRINGDNIFLDIPLLQRITDIATNFNFDFISNVHKRTFPKGMSVEAVKLQFYEKHLREIEADDRYVEHVTLYLYERLSDNNFYFIYNHELPEAGGVQFALDTQKDLIRTEKIISKFSKRHTYYNLKEIFKISQSI